MKNSTRRENCDGRSWWIANQIFFKFFWVFSNESSPQAKMNLLNLAQKLKIFSFLAVETLTKVELPWNLKLFWLVETTTMRPHWRKSRSRKRNSWSRQLQSWSGTNHSRSWTHRGQSHWCKGLSSTRTADGLPRISRQEVCYGEPRARRLANSIGIGVWIIWSPDHPKSGLKRWRRRWSYCSCSASLKIKIKWGYEIQQFEI